VYIYKLYSSLDMVIVNECLLSTEIALQSNLCKCKIFFRCKALFYFSEWLVSFFVSYVFAYVVNDCLPVFAVVTCMLITILSVFIGMSAFKCPRNFLNPMHANFSSQMC